MHIEIDFVMCFGIKTIISLICNDYNMGGENNY
jgi:hypothetical protein